MLIRMPVLPKTDTILSPTIMLTFGQLIKFCLTAVKFSGIYMFPKKAWCKLLGPKLMAIHPSISVKATQV